MLAVVEFVAMALVKEQASMRQLKVPGLVAPRLASFAMVLVSFDLKLLLKVRGCHHLKE